MTLGLTEMPVRSAISPQEPATVLKSSELFRTGPVIWIDVGSDRYQLRLTRNGKLILTK